MGRWVNGWMSEWGRNVEVLKSRNVKTGKGQEVKSKKVKVKRTKSGS